MLKRFGAIALACLITLAYAPARADGVTAIRCGQLLNPVDGSITRNAVIVVNGERGSPPTQRPQPIEDSLRIAAESMRYCIVETADLYDALIEKMNGGDAKDFCKALYETEGFYRKAAPATAAAEAAADSAESK